MKNHQNQDKDSNLMHSNIEFTQKKKFIAEQKV